MAETSEDVKECSRTILWGVPRSVSTAFTLCLSAIEGVEVWFEPSFYCHFAKLETDIKLGNERRITEIEDESDILITQRRCEVMNGLYKTQFDRELLSYTSVKRMLESVRARRVFVKDLSYCSDDQIPHIPKGFNHTFLIRHPLRVMRPFRKGIFYLLRERGKVSSADEDTFDLERDNPYCPKGFFVKELYDIWKFVRENFDENPVVIDGDDLLADPANVVSAYCSAVGLPYDEKVLKWDSSRSLDVLKTWKAPAPDLFVRIADFYSAALRSSEFLPASPMPSRCQLTPDVIRCADQVMEYYEEMFKAKM